MTWRGFQQTVEKHRITYGVLTALAIGVLMTMISMALYISSGASRLDLSRPGYESARQEINASKEKSEFSSVGPVNEEVLADFQSRFDQRFSDMKKLGAFNSNALSDEELRIAQNPEQSTPQ